MITCQWYADCDNPADGTVQHPALGLVPTCQRCTDKHDLPLMAWKDNTVGDLHQLAVTYTLDDATNARTEIVLIEDGYTTVDDVPAILATAHFGGPGYANRVHVSHIAAKDGDA